MKLSTLSQASMPIALASFEAPAPQEGGQHCPHLEKFAGCLPMSVGSIEIIHEEFPRRGDHDCIIIHRRLYIKNGRTDLDFSSNICFECTVLHGTLQGVEETFSRKLFSLRAVRTAVTSNQNSLVKSELSFSVENMPLSQSTIALSQSTVDL